jgi:hypothetical protein
MGLKIIINYKNNFNTFKPFTWLLIKFMGSYFRKGHKYFIKNILFSKILNKKEIFIIFLFFFNLINYIINILIIT